MPLAWFAIVKVLNSNTMYKNFFHLRGIFQSSESKTNFINIYGFFGGGGEIRLWYPNVHTHDHITIIRPPMLKPGQGMIHRLKCELVYALALSKSRSASWWSPGAESMMELLSVVETRMVVGGGRQCGGSCCLGQKAWKKWHEKKGKLVI